MQKIFLIGRSYNNGDRRHEQSKKKRICRDTYVTALGQCINPACICMYLRLTERKEGEKGWTGGNPYVTSSPTRTSARFVSLADFCRLTPKHPWTLPPPFTFNLYQSIQPSRRIERTSMNETGRTGRERHRALFTADSLGSIYLFHRVSPSYHPPSYFTCVPFVASYPKQSILRRMEPLYDRNRSRVSLLT